MTAPGDHAVEVALLRAADAARLERLALLRQQRALERALAARTPLWRHALLALGERAHRVDDRVAARLAPRGTWSPAAVPPGLDPTGDPRGALAALRAADSAAVDRWQHDVQDHPLAQRWIDARATGRRYARRALLKVVS